MEKVLPTQESSTNLAFYNFFNSSFKSCFGKNITIISYFLKKVEYLCLHGIEMPNKPGFNRFWSFTNVSQLVFCTVKIIDHFWGLTVNGRLYFNFLSWVWFSDRFPYLARLQTSEGTHSTWRFVASSLNLIIL